MIVGSRKPSVRDARSATSRRPGRRRASLNVVDRYGSLADDGLAANGHAGLVPGPAVEAVLVHGIGARPPLEERLLGRVELRPEGGRVGWDPTCRAVTEFELNPMTPGFLESPPGGAIFWMSSAKSCSCRGRSAHRPWSGADDAVNVRRIEPTIAIGHERRRRRAPAARRPTDGSPIFRRVHVTSSSNTCVRIRRKSAAALNTTRR